MSYVEREQAWKLVVPNRWCLLSPSRFDAEAEKPARGYSFRELRRAVLVRASGTTARATTLDRSAAPASAASGKGLPCPTRVARELATWVGVLSACLANRPF